MRVLRPALWLLLAACVCLPTPTQAAPVAVELDLVQTRLLRRTSPRYLVCGHRGAYFHRPHNSPKSIENALRNGADLIEIDVETTADHQCVLAHDAWPRKKTLAQWRAGGKGLTSLAAGLKQIGTRAVTVVDVKTPHIAAVVRDIRAEGAGGRVVLLPGSGEAYAKLRALDKALYVMGRARSAADVRALLAAADPTMVIIHGDYEWMQGAIVRQIRATGRRTFVNSYRLSSTDERFGARDTAFRVFRRGIGIAQTNHIRSAVVARNRMRRKR